MHKDEQNIDERLSRLYAAHVPESFETGWRADIRREESIRSMKTWHGTTMWKRLVPALCMMVLVVGGLWAGTWEREDVMLQGSDVAYTMVTSRSASTSSAANGMAAKYSLMEAEEAAYDTAVSYDMGISTYGAVQQTERKLVRTADMTIRTDAFDDALSQVQTRLDEMGGYIENLYQYGEETRRISLSMRVPSEKLDAFLSAMEGAGKVTDRSESTMDMTTQYTDNQARLDTLYQKRERLNELLKQAQSVADLIEIESAISDTQYQIDSYETSQRSIDRQVDMSAVSLTLVEQEKTIVNRELTLGERISAGFASACEWAVDFGADVLVFVVTAAPFAAGAGALWGVWKLIKKVFKRRENA